MPQGYTIIQIGNGFAWQKDATGIQGYVWPTEAEAIDACNQYYAVDKNIEHLGIDAAIPPIPPEGAMTVEEALADN